VQSESPDPNTSVIYATWRGDETFYRWGYLTPGENELMTIFKYENGYRAKVTYSLDGRSLAKYFRGRTRAEVRSKATAYLETHNLSAPDPGMTVEKCCQLAIQRAEQRGCRPSTLRLYKGFLDRHVRSIARRPVAEIKPWDVENLMSKMETGRQTKLLVRGFLRMAINKVAIKSGIVTQNAAALADTPRKTRQAQKPRLTPEDLTRILNSEDDPTRRAMYLTIATTGLRVGEAMMLTWSEIKRREDGYWIELTQSKTEEGLEPIPIPSTTWTEIEALGKRAVFVFPNSVGTPYDQPNLRRQWLKALSKAGVQETNIYKLRHLFGTVHARNVSDVVLKRLMRHTDVRTSKQYYATALEADLRAAVEK
jgi:integrase